MTPLSAAPGPLAAGTVAAVAVASVAAAVLSGPAGTRAAAPGSEAPAPRPPGSTAEVVARAADGTGSGRPLPPATPRQGTPGPLTAAGPRWRWPVQPQPLVLRLFRAPRTAYGAGHRGLDLGARSGDAVRAVEAGVVTHAGVVAGRGTVTVTHRDGVRSTYEPVSADVSLGDQVVTGDVVGILQPGGTHCGARECLHLGARRGAVYIDPLPLLVTGTLALLPLQRP